MALQKKIDDLFMFTMKGKWNDVVEIYRAIPEAQKAKITKSGETALHIAVSVGQTDIAVELVEMVEEDILSIVNVRGNTALHIAAAIGDLRVCQSIASRDLDLMKIRNNNGEIPLFLAAVYGKKETLLYLNTLCTESDHVRRNNGDTILHAAIAGEYFSLAMSIIEARRELIDSMNEDGLSPLHVLASKPNVFRSSTPLGCFDRLLYKCLVVDDLKEQEIDDVEAYIKKRTKRVKESHKYPENYKTCINFLVLLKVFFQVLFSNVVNQTWRIKKDGKNSTADEENPQQKSSSSVHGREWDEDHCFPPNYGFCVQAFKFIMNVLLIVLGIGLWRIKNIQQKKKRHMWANRVMNELVKHTTSYKAYDNTGWEPQINRAGEEFDVPNDLTLLEENQLTPILIAAKMGVVEIVEKILDEFPVAIQDLDCNNKNVVLLAVENRQPQVYNLLLNKNILKESLFRQLDNEGNSALHLAAQCKDHQPWLIPGGALQMQWEIKWYKFVKSSMPPHFFARYNAKHETARDIFVRTHKDLSKEGSKWLNKTSDSCSLVAALVASVAFTTSATVPGGLDQLTGKPILQDEPAFSAYVISSLVALCFSITALVFFLSILTSRCQEKDFAMDLPKKLLLGLTSLFASIASMLISFCDGHIFVLRPQLRGIAYPLYVALCFPITYFAFAQLSLYLDLIWAIVKKVPQRCNKAFLE
ncbi:hypothetical protein UlMin_010316 [Ulmus minor]